MEVVAFVIYHDGIRSSMKTKFHILLCVLVLAGPSGLPAGARDAPASLEDGGGVLQAAGGVTVTEYCETFARTYASKHALDYQEHSARVRKRSDAMRWLSNRFQPPDSRFTSGYTCRFRARAREGQGREFSVGLFLTGTLEFAEYTQWKGLQIIPIGFVVDPRNDRRGYGVFKYLEKP